MGCVGIGIYSHLLTPHSQELIYITTDAKCRDYLLLDDGERRIITAKTANV
jgi:hypothetical protein